MEKTGENIRRIRLLMGYKQQTMADLLHISNYYYGLIERDKVPLNLERLHRIAEILNINIIYLLNFNSLLNLIQNTPITVAIETKAPIH